jgi:UDP-3-O-[3-hydroxymyristoyl] N-acetylglucosamine deacetylase/3-hydroxyacyl-[acyl-carrier-protein] dehydratase
VRNQQTICRDVEIGGRGLFTGEAVTMRVRPVPAHTGIVFVRTDQSPPIRIPALVENVSKRSRRTALRNGTVAIETVEHCLSACSGLGVDNVQIELSGNEIPAMDGSCLPLVIQIRDAGIQQQEAICESYVVTEMVRVVDGDSELIALPPLNPGNDFLEITYDLDYGNQGPIGRQIYRITVTPESFVTNIAPARTFVLKQEAEAMRAAGLGTHLTPADVVVFGDEGPIDNALRFPDECVRHKILDVIGDLALFGCRIVGRIYARKSGHALNHALVRALKQQRSDAQRARRLTERPELDIGKIQRVLPHRYPFLMVDRIIELDGTRRAVGVKNVTINEPYFQGHYPGNPIMPGVLVIEALAQMGGMLLSQVLEHKGKVAVLLSLDKVKFRRAVRPGDQLEIAVETIKVRSSTGHLKGIAKVAGELAAEAEIKFILTDAE